MKRAFAAWKWSFVSVVRSYRTVVAVGALIALWIFTAYEWLGMPAESSLLLMTISLLWAIVQILAAAVILGGLASGAAETAASGDGRFPARALWTLGRKMLASTVIFCILSFILVWLCGAVFDWINAHSIEVASFLTFHTQKPVSHVVIEKIYDVIENFLWIVLSGFLLSWFVVLRREGWGPAIGQILKLVLGNAFRAPLLTNLLSLAVFGGIAYELANWHPLVTPGFWDYAQMVTRMVAALALISAGALYWPLALARLLTPRPDQS